MRTRPMIMLVAPLAIASMTAHAGLFAQTRDSGSHAVALSPGLATGPHEIAVGGVRLWYRVAGNAAASAPPVVYLDGGPGGNSYVFSVLQGSRLETSLRMVYFDERGTGHSERPASRDYRISSMVDDVEGLRSALGVPKIALIGHSFGGLLALEYAARYPDHLSHLILVSTPPDFPASCALRKERLVSVHPELRSKIAADSARSRPQSDCLYEFQLLPDSARQAFNDALMFPDSSKRTVLEDLERRSNLPNTGELSRAVIGTMLGYRFERNERLTMPVLIIAGAADGAVGEAPQERFARSLRTASFRVYEHSGHFPQLDEPDRFARDVIEFVRAR